MLRKRNNNAIERSKTICIDFTFLCFQSLLPEEVQFACNAITSLQV
jgi:hypothetical protein